MELETLEVLLEVNTKHIQESINRVMPQISGMLKRIEGLTGASGEKIEQNLDVSDGVQTMQKSMERIVNNFSKQMDRMEELSKQKTESTSRNLEQGFKQTRTKAGKEIDLMIKDINAKMGQARAAQNKIAHLTAKRTAAIDSGEPGQVVKYDEQIARAEHQMTSYQNKAQQLARTMQQEFDAVPQSLSKISAMMDQNESQIETLRAKIANMQQVYESQRKTVGSFDDGFSTKDSKESVDTMQKIQVQQAKMNKLIQANDGLQRAYAVTEDRAESLRNALAGLTTNLDQSTIKTGNAAMGMKTVAAQSDEAKSKWSNFGGLFNRVSNNIAHGTRRIRNGVSGFFNLFNRSSEGGSRTLAKGGNQFNRYAMSIRKTMWMLGNQLIVFTLLYQGIMALGTGMLNSLKANEQFAASLNQIKVNLLTAFYPIYQAVLPAINALMDAVARLTGYLASLIATLFGSTYAAAKQGASGLYDNVKALEATGTNADKAKDKLKELKSSLMGFDEINRIGLDVGKEESLDGGKGTEGINFGTPDFQTPAWLSKFAENAKDILSRLFAPVQAAWDKHGQQVMDSFKFALSEVWELVKSIGRSFMEVWTDGTGERILSNILVIVANIITSIGNLANGLREAWETNNLGVSIFQSILGIIEDATVHMWDMAEATAAWTESLDFTPLLTSVDTLLKAVRPLTDKIGEGLSWFYTEVLLPIGKWAIEDAVPAFLDLLSGALEVLDGIIESLKPTFNWLWDEVLQPIAEWTGGIIVSVLENLGDALSNIGDWIDDNQTTVSNFIVGIGVFAGSLKVISGLGTAVSVISGLFGALKGAGGLTGVLSLIGKGIGGLVTALGGPWVVGIAAAITAGVLLWKNWDTIMEKVKQLGDWISEKWDAIGKKTSEAWNKFTDTVKDKAESARKWGAEKIDKLRIASAVSWDAIKTKTATIWDNISTTVRDKSESARRWGSDKISSLKNTVSTHWSNLKTDTAIKWEEMKNAIGNKAETARSNASNAFRNMSDKASEYGGKIKTAMSGAFDKVTGWASSFGTNVANGLNKGIGAIRGAAANIGNGLINVIKSAVNGVIGGVNWVLGKVGSNTKLATWQPAVIKAYAKGTNFHPGGAALVNDAPGSNFQEAYEVNGKVGLFPKVRNMLVDLPKGAKVLDGNRTAAMYGGGIPRYANGIGDWFSKTWNGAKQMAGTVWDYVSNPEKLLDVAISKFVNLSKAMDPALSIAKGSIGTIARGATNYVKGLLDQGPPESGFGGINFKGLVKTSGFGYRTHPITGRQHLHAGVDYAGGGGIGHPIHAQTGGTVQSAGPTSGGYGNWVNIKNGVYDHIYAHLSKALVNRGAAVTTGQKIGLMGNTGESTGPHVHYEVRKNGTPMDPEKLVTSALGGASNFSGGVARWRTTIMRALAMNGLPTTSAYVNAWMKQIQTESGGNEKAVQSASVVDINTLQGNPARGLLQTIPQTFNAYKFPGHGNIYDGYHNALAAINYAKNRYGASGMLSVIGKGHGYENGGMVSKQGYYRLAEGNKKELVIPLERRNRALELLDIAKEYLGVQETGGLQMPDVFLDKPQQRFNTPVPTNDVGGGGMSGVSEAIVSLLGQLGNVPSGSNRQIKVVVEVDGKVIGQKAIEEINETIDRTGENPLNI